MPEIVYFRPLGEPVRVTIDGEPFIAEAAYRRLWNEQRELIEKLREKQRSIKSHGHYFALVNELWETMPESMSGLPYAKSADHFRKHGLISVGYGDTDVMDCGNHQVAIAAAPLVAKAARKSEGYAIVTVRGGLITCTTAQSQTYKAMGKDEFEKSKNLVLDWMHQQLGTRP